MGKRAKQTDTERKRDRAGKGTLGEANFGEVQESLRSGTCLFLLVATVLLGTVACTVATTRRGPLPLSRGFVVGGRDQESRSGHDLWLTVKVRDPRRIPRRLEALQDLEQP